ncbi:MAG TPA: hypothetical protein PKH33_17680 [bacterium]|nr:hypothetical protein [bacterium]HPN95306.1 hypothetical protein [bacterium]
MSAIQDMEDYVRNNGGKYSEWYAGIATDPDYTLFTRHNVDRVTGKKIYRTFSTDTQARQVEKYFLDKGCAGDDGGGDSSTKSAYLYKETSTTRR